MALNDEVRIEESTSKRSQTTGHLLIVMPKLNAKSCLAVTKYNKNHVKKPQGLKESVQIHSIVIDESEIPPLI